MRKLILLPLLLLVACGESAEPNATNGNGQGNTPAVSSSNQPSTPATPSAGTASTPSISEEQIQEKLNDADIRSGSKPLIGSSTAQQPAYEPKRTPTHNFKVGGPIADAQLGDYHVELTVAVDGEQIGTMSFELWPQWAPGTVRNFLRYCDEGFYDGLGFHRIMRDFMVQGGDPKGDGSGDGPHGNIVAEFKRPEQEGRIHGYGVLSMARGNGPNTASCQFFVCCAETPSVWNLDAGYASFGKLTKGVDVLEKMASVPVGGPRRSSPMRQVTIVKAEVLEGEAPRGDKPIERPMPPLPEGEPADVIVQHVLISYKDAPRPVPGVERSKEDGQALVDDITKRAEAGEDFSALVTEFSDDSLVEGVPLPGAYRLWNTGYQDIAEAKRWFQINQEQRNLVQTLRGQIQAQTLTPELAQEQLNAAMVAAETEHGPQPMPRGQMVAGFSNTAFALKVGEVKVLAPDASASPFGWHIMKRIK